MSTSINDRLYNFATGLVGNRVFDLYLKYMGIKTLTTATLVPIALIMGKQELEKFIKTTKQEGGSKNLPVLDDPLIGNYLKLAGLSGASFSLNTLVPLGTLMLIYELYMKKESQTGGNMTSYVKRVYGNRVVDLFLKYKGIKMLTSSTLVPIALILGKNMLEKVLSGKQVGGAIPDDLPFLDDPLLGNYLKVTGLSVLSLTMDTMVPLSILAVLYNIYLAE
tara:strand:+ start:1176 stop:1838 length:663 start_codon:yes stop_codon:yes gene_type:complete